MKKFIQPTWLINHYKYISPAQLAGHGYSGVIVDLDNTTLAWYQDEPDQTLVDWVQSHKNEGVKIFMVSNNKKERVQKIAQKLAIPYQHFALKPLSRGFNKALSKLNLTKDQVLVIGDQLFTDVLGANLAGLDSVLVKPLVESDLAFTWLNRQLERKIHTKLKINLQEDWGKTLE